MYSEITRMRQQIDQEHEAAIHGLLGPAVVASHTCVEARLTRGANRILDLFEQQQFSEALHLMEHASWGEEDSSSQEHTIQQESKEPESSLAVASIASPVPCFESVHALPSTPDNYEAARGMNG
jgi:hypothetical protein